MIQEPLTLAGLVAGITALSLWLDYRFAPLSKIGAALIAIVLGATLSNLGLVPAGSPVYDAVTGPVTFLAIAWLLLAVDLSDVKRAGPRMLSAFALACAGTVVGAFAGAALFAGVFTNQNAALAGTLTGTYTGGSLNFVSVGRALNLDGTLFAAATAADNLTTGLWLGATLLLPLWLRRFFPAPPPSVSGDADGAGPDAHPHAHHPLFAEVGLSALRIGILIAVGAALVVAAGALGDRTPGVPSVVWLTSLALIVGNATPLRRSPGALQLGSLALTAFFVVIGIFSRIADILAVGIEVFFFTLTVVGIHGLIVYGLGRAARLDLASLSVASQAAVGGPSSALAVAISRDWKGLVLPGIIVGLLGYAVGTYLGLAVALSVRTLGW